MIKDFTRYPYNVNQYLYFAINLAKNIKDVQLTSTGGLALMFTDHAPSLSVELLYPLFDQGMVEFTWIRYRRKRGKMKGVVRVWPASCPKHHIDHLNMSFQK